MNRKQIQRFQKFIELDMLTGCWIWKGCLRNGYGTVKQNGKMQLAHRISFVHWNGEIKQGLEIDHLCRNKICCNPSHLEAVTHLENLKRGNIGLFNKNKTHCIYGHEFTKENTIIKQDGRRNCRTCINRLNREWRMRQNVIKC